MNASKLFSFVLASVLVAPSLAVTLTQPTQLQTTSYDYVIVGAGTAGLALASRLSENPKVSVLVLEAGISDEGNIPIQAPFLGPTLTPNTQLDWNYTITPQVGMNGRTFAYPRGKVLGGSSSVNYLFHQFGTKEDWDRLGAVSGDNGWTWANMRKYVQKHEKFVPPIDGHNTTGQFIPSNHGFNGAVSVTLQGFNTTIDSRAIGVTKDLPQEFPFNQDLAGGDQPMLGLGYVQTSASGGIRSSSSVAYLAPANTRPNLTVLINATVMKLLSTTPNSRSLKAFRSIQFTNTPGTAPTPAGRTFTVTARKEVILSAGSVGSTQILMLSGIGDPNKLKALKIPLTLTNNDVGENLSDHTLLPNIFNVVDTPKSVGSLDRVLGNATQVQNVLQQYVTTHTGMFANNIANNFGFFRISDKLPVFKTTPDPAPGVKSPHWELINSDFYVNPGVDRPTTGNFMTVAAVLLTPTSRGSITLKSNNPFDKPLINPN
ncbi:hypothetical protein D9619_010367 [Psilocybe cf. subviscida]|uniref:Glucose-methanol-choline oxidoreductase N-terminal domain-containing protein n=1 Tax=Psilocybe cf. subviscida TaxID=2480587 RepID=A0A8H5ERP2_9AGAR|nr:hypothetical protein D9619_010367 [Psilocybe cf. subviscida]